MKVQVSKLSHHPLNREIYSLSDIDSLTKSIQEVGLLQPLVIDQKSRVISGNRRLESIRALGFKTVEVQKIKITDKEVGRLLIHHNKQRVKTNRELLNEYHQLKKYYSVGQGKRTDLESTSVKTDRSLPVRHQIADELGISHGRINQLLFIEKHNPERIKWIDEGLLTTNQTYLQIRKEKNEKESRRSKRSKKQTGKDNYIFYQKSSDEMKEVDDESVQLVFTSPPYWNKRKFSNNKRANLGHEPLPEDYVNNLVSHFDDTYRVLNPKGSFFLNMGDSFLNRNLLNLPHKVAISLQEKGWILRNTIIWSKTNTKPSSTNINLVPTYDFIFHFVKSEKYYYEPTLTKLVDNPREYEKKIHLIFHKNKAGKTQRELGIAFPKDEKRLGDFWSEDIVRTAVSNQTGHARKKEHPAPFNAQIVELPLLQTTKINDLVLDPFHGSGTTGGVAIQHQRKYIGYDLVRY